MHRITFSEPPKRGRQKVLIKPSTDVERREGRERKVVRNLRDRVSSGEGGK